CRRSRNSSARPQYVAGRFVVFDTAMKCVHLRGQLGSLKTSVGLWWSQANWRSAFARLRMKATTASSLNPVWQNGPPTFDERKGPKSCVMRGVVVLKLHFPEQVSTSTHQSTRSLRSRPSSSGFWLFSACPGTVVWPLSKCSKTVATATHRRHTSNERTRDGPLVEHLHPQGNLAEPLMKKGGTLFTMTYYGSQMAKSEYMNVATKTPSELYSTGSWANHRTSRGEYVGRWFESGQGSH